MLLKITQYLNEKCRTCSSAKKWFLWGAAFGVFFPILAVILRFFQYGNRAIDVIVSDPLLWIIATAPLFLGLFAHHGGGLNDKVIEFNHQLEEKVKQRTQSLHDAKTSLEHEHSHMNTILSSMSDALIVVNKELIVTDKYSQKAREIFGDIEGKSLLTLLFPSDDRNSSVAYRSIEDALVSAFNLIISSQFQSLQAMIPKTIKLRPVNNSHHLFSYRLKLGAIIDKKDNITDLIITLNDISEIEPLRNSVDFAQAEVSRGLDKVNELLSSPALSSALQESLVEMREMAQVCSQSVEHFANDLDINEVFRKMHTIKGGARSFGLAHISHFAHAFETIMSELRDGYRRKEEIDLDQLRAHCSKVTQGLETMWNLVARTPSNHAVDPCYLWNAYCLQLISGSELLAADLGKRTLIHIQSSHCVFGKDVAVLKQALTHLIRNAIDHGLEYSDERIEAGKFPTGLIDIQIDFEPTTHSWHVVIKDDGQGIDSTSLLQKAKERNLSDIPQRLDDAESILKILCHPGFSSKSESNDISGRGVGMDAVLKVLTENGGFLKLDQFKKSQGCHFTLHWQAQETNFIACSPYPNDATMLIVDDEKDFSSMVHQLIEENLLQLKVLSSSSGHNAEVLLAEHKFNLVATDLRMPDGSGYELLHHLQKHYPHVDKSVLSGQIQENQRQTIAQLGCTLFDKPLDTRAFCSFVDKTLRRQKLSRAEHKS